MRPDDTRRCPVPSTEEPEWPDIVAIFKEAWHKADEAGAVGERVESGLKAVFKVVAWEMHDLPLPPDPLGRRTLLCQHVLHRAGDQGNGS